MDQNQNQDPVNFDVIPDHLLRGLTKALTEDSRLQDVIDMVEKEILIAALRRHKKLEDVYRGVRMSKSTFFARKARYFENHPKN